jgi:hypothetical protein
MGGRGLVTAVVYEIQSIEDKFQQTLQLTIFRGNVFDRSSKSLLGSPAQLF